MLQAHPNMFWQTMSQAHPNMFFIKQMETISFLAPIHFLEKSRMIPWMASAFLRKYAAIEILDLILPEESVFLEIFCATGN